MQFHPQEKGHHPVNDDDPVYSVLAECYVNVVLVLVIEAVGVAPAMRPLPVA